MGFEPKLLLNENVNNIMECNDTMQKIINNVTSPTYVYIHICNRLKRELPNHKLRELTDRISWAKGLQRIY